MREIPSDNAEHKQKRRGFAILCGVVLLVLLIVAAVNLGWIGAADTSKPAVAPAPLASAAVQVSPVPKAEDVLPTNISDLMAYASGGNALACFELGERYRIGRGCIRDEEEALRWYDKAAADDDTAVVLKLAKAYEVLGRRNRAENKFEKAALRGVREAQLWMAYRHLKDATVEVSDTYAWFNICAAWGDVASNATRDHMEKTYPAVTITKGQVRAREIAIMVEAYVITKAKTVEAQEIAKANPGRGALLRQKALAGDLGAQVELGDAYLAGSYFPRDFSEAVRWYKLASEAGSTEANATLARHYEVSLKTDYALARSYHLKASLAGHVASQFSVAERYLSGINGFEQDDVEAYAWYNVSAASGNKEAAAARDRLEFQMISTQKAAAQKRSREILKEIEAKKEKK